MPWPLFLSTLKASSSVRSSPMYTGRTSLRLANPGEGEIRERQRKRRRRSIHPSIHPSAAICFWACSRGCDTQVLNTKTAGESDCGQHTDGDKTISRARAQGGKYGRKGREGSLLAALSRCTYRAIRAGTPTPCPCPT
jgi:hypothetical protein